MPEPKHVDRVREQFNRQAEAYAGMQVVRDERMIEFLAGISGVTREDRVIDVACGPGFMTMAFAERSARIVGVDITDRFLESARAEAARRGLGNVTFLQGDVENLHFGPATFRIALCRFAFHHFPRPEQVLAEMKRVLTRDGKIVLADMLSSEDPDKAQYQDRIERLCDPTHASALSESRFKRMFGDLGLKVAFEVKGETSYLLEDWLRHGGPGPEATKEIEALMRDSIEVDRSGLKVRLEDETIHFTHTGATFVLSRDA